MLAKRILFLASWPFMAGISLIPFWALYLVSDSLAYLLFKVFKYRLKVINANLAAAFPEKSIEDRQSIAARFYTNLSDVLLESLKMRRLSDNEIIKRCPIEGLEMVNRARLENRPVVIVTGHYGNWEWGGLSISAVHKTSPVVILYQDMRNTYQEAFINRLRARFGSVLVSIKNITRTVVLAKKDASVMVLLADQAPFPNPKNPVVQFLNQPTSFFFGPEKIARMTDAAFFFGAIQRVRRGYYQITLEPLPDDVSITKDGAVTAWHVKRLEELICAEPSSWLWSHRRWKYGNEFT